MSIAPDVAPEVLIPVTARRTARDTRGARSVSGNVITPSAFHLIDLEAGVDGAHRLRLVTPVPSLVDDPLRSRHRSGAVGGRVGGAVGEGATAVSVRLTARGRLVSAVAAVVVALGIAVGAWFGGVGPGDAPGATPPAAEVVVHDGDTLWSIATAVAPGRDPRATVEHLRRLNGLGSADLAPGQVLRLH